MQNIGIRPSCGRSSFALSFILRQMSIFVGKDVARFVIFCIVTGLMLANRMPKAFYHTRDMSSPYHDVFIEIKKCRKITIFARKSIKNVVLRRRGQAFLCEFRHSVRPNEQQ